MTISGEILVYVNQPRTKFRWLAYISSIQIGFVLINLFIMPTPKLLEERAKLKQNLSDKLDKKETLNSESDDNKASLWEGFKKLDYVEIFSPRNAIDNIIQRPVTSTAILVALALVPTASFIYCKRMAHMITLLPNDRVRFTSFPPFGLRKPSSIEVPLKDVSCVQGRKSDVNYSVLKFRGFFGYHLVHKIQGRFLEPKLYDLHLGYAKSWASKD